VTCTTLYKDGGSALVEKSQVVNWVAKGWSEEAPPAEAVDPVLDFTPLDQPQMLHVAAILSLPLSDGDRAALEDAIREKWVAAGRPSDYLEKALAETAPIPIEEMVIPLTNAEEETVETPEEFAEHVKDVVPPETTEETPTEDPE